jgi:hypothetical protein
MSRKVELCEVPEMIADLTAVICLAPFVQQPDESTLRGGRELADAIRRIKRDLDDFLTDDVKNGMRELLDHIDRNRDRYRDAVLLWVDLMEEIAALMEHEYGDGTGAMKQRKVRAAMYYLMKSFVGNQPLPHVPPFLRPIVLEIAIRWTVEFLVTLDNAQSQRPQLWDGIVTPAKGHSRALTTEVHFVAWWEHLQERLGTWIVGWFLKPPRLTGTLRLKVDLIIRQWAERNEATGTTPVERTAGTVFQTAIWIGDHADEVRALVDLVSVAVLEAAKLSRLSRNQRIAVIKEAIVILVQEDLGFGGPLWGEIIRMVVDIMADAIDDLFRKRGLIAA